VVTLQLEETEAYVDSIDSSEVTNAHRHSLLGVQDPQLFNWVHVVKAITSFTLHEMFRQPEKSNIHLTAHAEPYRPCRHAENILGATCVVIKLILIEATKNYHIIHQKN
jgi:hypothetical protein